MRVVHTAVRSVAGLLGMAVVPMAAYSAYLTFVGAAGVAADAPTRFYFGVMALVGATSGVIAAMVALRGGVGRVPAAFSVFFAMVALAAMDHGEFRLLSLVVGGALPPWAEWWWRPVLFFGAGALGSAATVRIPQLFPRPLEPSDVRATPGPRLLRRLQSRLHGPGPAWLGFGVLGWVGLVAVFRWFPEAAMSVTVLFMLSALVVAISFFRIAYARGDDEDRRRIYWIMEGGLICAGTLAVVFWLELAYHTFGLGGPVIRWLHGALLPLGMLATVGVLAVGILYKGALNSRLVVRQTMLYGLVGFFLTAVFVGVETLVESVLSTRLGLPDVAGSYAAGFAAALVFGPLRGAIERRLPG